MRYEIIVAPEAVQDIRRQTVRERSTVKDTIERHLRHEPKRISRSRIKRLRSVQKSQYRLRVDDIRVFYDVTEGRLEYKPLSQRAEPPPGSMRTECHHEKNAFI